MTFYELVKQDDKRVLRAVGHFTVDELIEAEHEGYRIVDDKPKHRKLAPKKRKKPFMRRHEEIDWSVFDKVN